MLKKAIAMGHRILVVINKIDKPDADPASVVDKTFDLFCELGASDEQTDFPIVYTSAINRVAGDAACSGWPGLTRPRSQQPTRPSTTPEVPHAGAGLPPWALRGAPSPIWVPRSRLRRRSGALPKVADHAAFAHPGISINGEPVLNLRQMYALVQRLHGGCGMGQSCRPDKRQSWPPTARGALALGCRAELGLLGPLRAALEPLSPRRRPSR